MVDLRQGRRHLHLGGIGDRGHGHSREGVVARLELAVFVAAEVLGDDENAAAARVHGDRPDRLLGGLQRAPGFLFGRYQRVEVGPRRHPEGVPFQARLLKGGFLLVEGGLHLRPLEGRAQLLGHGRIDAGLVGLHPGLVHRRDLLLALGLERAFAGLALDLGLAQLRPPFLERGLGARGFELDHAVALGHVCPVVGEPGDLDLHVLGTGDGDVVGPHGLQLAGEQEHVLQRPGRHDRLAGPGLRARRGISTTAGHPRKDEGKGRQGQRQAAFTYLRHSDSRRTDGPTREEL